MVIAAGSTGSIPATARLLAVIARLPNGAVVLPGLDRGLDEESWRDLDPGHPQFGMKQLLDTIRRSRERCRGLARGRRQSRARDSAAAKPCGPRPPPMPGARWPNAAATTSRAGLEGIALVAAADPARGSAGDRAGACARRWRHDGRTAALVTPDRNLARRVAAELTRWDIAIDDSAGRPLAHTSAGAFLCLLAEAAEARFAPVPLLALLKHPFATSGRGSRAFPRPRARAGPLVLARTAPRSGACRHRHGASPRRRAEARSKDDRETWRGWRRGGTKSPPSWRRWSKLSRRPNCRWTI